MTLLLDLLQAPPQQIDAGEKLIDLRKPSHEFLGKSLAEIAKQVETILTTAFSINKKLKGRVDLSMAFALSDIKAQLEALIYRGFATDCGWKRLPDILRYMKAIERRMEKLPIDPNKDRIQLEVELINPREARKTETLSNSTASK